MTRTVAGQPAQCGGSPSPWPALHPIGPPNPNRGQGRLANRLQPFPAPPASPAPIGPHGEEWLDPTHARIYTLGLWCDNKKYRNAVLYEGERTGADVLARSSLPGWKSLFESDALKIQCVCGGWGGGCNSLCMCMCLCVCVFNTFSLFHIVHKNI